MDINRAATLAKALAKDRALAARERRDEAIKNLRLSDHEAYPGSGRFSETVKVVAQYLSDLTDAKVSSIQDAYAQTGIAMTGHTVGDALSALDTTFQTVISTRLGAWKDALKCDSQDLTLRSVMSDGVATVRQTVTRANR
jgi:hypothetical protein